MCSKSQGSDCLSEPEYSRRTKCRGVGMQHAVPSRSVCVAYHGMTVPLPASALCGPPGSSSSSGGRQLRTHVVNSLSTSEERQKDSGIQSQFTSEMSCNGSAASSPACTEKDIDIMERGELIQSDCQQPAHTGEDLDERESGNDHMPSLLELPTECLHTSVGLADTASLPVAAAYDPMDTPPPLSLAEPFLSAEIDYAEPSPTPGGLPAALPSEKAGTTSAGDQVKGEEPSSSVRSTAATAGWSQVGRGRTLMHILSSRPVGRGQASADCSIPEGQHLPRSGPDLEVKETETSPSTLKQPISVGPGQGQAVSSGQKTQRSSRKAKVSLAIKFQGADAPQHIAPGSSPGLQNSAPASQVCLKASPQVLMKPSEFRVPSTEHLHMQSGAPEPPEPASTQGRSPGLAHTESEGSRVMPACTSGMEKDVLHSQALSSDGDELDFVETRGGRSANELEKSIAGHQRSIHRNQTELKRIQKRNRAMEEELAGDLAEQCQGGLGEDDHLQEATPEMLLCLDRLIGLQGQLVAQSEEVKRRAIANEQLFERGKSEYENDKLASMEWKLEIEASELEDKLLLARLETHVLQAKTEILL